MDRKVLRVSRIVIVVLALVAGYFIGHASNGTYFDAIDYGMHLQEMAELDYSLQSDDYRQTCQSIRDYESGVYAGRREVMESF